MDSMAVGAEVLISCIVCLCLQIEDLESVYLLYGKSATS